MKFERLTFGETNLHDPENGSCNFGQPYKTERSSIRTKGVKQKCMGINSKARFSLHQSRPVRIILSSSDNVGVWMLCFEQKLQTLISLKPLLISGLSFFSNLAISL